MSVRTERNNKFKSQYLDLIGVQYDIEYFKSMERYTIYDTPFGNIDFYPKCNKV